MSGDAWGSALADSSACSNSSGVNTGRGWQMATTRTGSSC